MDGNRLTRLDIKTLENAIESPHMSLAECVATAEVLDKLEHLVEALDKPDRFAALPLTVSREDEDRVDALIARRRTPNNPRKLDGLHSSEDLAEDPRPLRPEDVDGTGPFIQLSAAELEELRDRD